MDVYLLIEFKKNWLTCLIGVVLFCCGIWLLTWNEMTTVQHAHSLDEAYSAVITLNPYHGMQKEYEGRLVHISGPILVDEPLTEPEYGISIQAVKLKRRVQMYQWVEERASSLRDYSHINVEMSGGGSDDYYYFTEWRDKLVDSNSFYIRHGHHNPASVPLKSHVYVSGLVRVGQLIVGSELKAMFGDFVEVSSDERPERRDIKLHMGIYYHCDDVWNPRVGDIRVQFYYSGLSGEPVTIVAMQRDGELLPYMTNKRREILMLRPGTLSVHQMFSAERCDANYQTWKLRLAGTFVLYASLVCVSKMLKAIISRYTFSPYNESQDITSSTLLMIAVSLSMCAISTAWFFYRPWVAFSLIVASFAPFIWCVMGFLNGFIHHNVD